MMVWLISIADERVGVQ